MDAVSPLGSYALWFPKEDLASSHLGIYEPSLLMNRRARGRVTFSECFIREIEHHGKRRGDIVGHHAALDLNERR